ncbi:hypothetical protein FOL47_009676, partial [Perkinsus chesapeaki]
MSSPPISVVLDLGSLFIIGPVNAVGEIMNAMGDILGLRVGLDIKVFRPSKESISYYATCSILHLDKHKGTWIGFELGVPYKYTARVLLTDLVVEKKGLCIFEIRGSPRLLEFDWIFGEPFFKAHETRLYYDTLMIGLTERQLQSVQSNSSTANWSSDQLVHGPTHPGTISYTGRDEVPTHPPPA